MLPTTKNDAVQSSYTRRKRQFDQLIDEDEFNDDQDIINDFPSGGQMGTTSSNNAATPDMGSEGDDFALGPIQCDESDDGPDFSRMAKKQRGG